MGYQRSKRRSKSQLNAISYSYSAKEEQRLSELVKTLGLTNEFYNSKYKTKTGFLKSKGLL